MYAIIEMGKKQFRVAEGDELRVPLRPEETGTSLEISDVLVVNNGEDVRFGAPYVANAKVQATVLNHGRDKKVIVFKKKKRKGYKKTMGHRQYFTLIKVNSISLA